MIPLSFAIEYKTIELTVYHRSRFLNLLLSSYKNHTQVKIFCFCILLNRLLSFICWFNWFVIYIYFTESKHEQKVNKFKLLNNTVIMYFPIGWPKFYNSQLQTGKSDVLKVVRFNRSRSLFVTISDSSVYLWKMRVCAKFTY